MQIQVLLVACELGDFLREDSDVTLLELLFNRKCGAIGGQDLGQLWLVLLLHKLVKVTLRPQEDLQLLGLGKVLERGALFQEKIQEVLALTQHSRVLLTSCSLFRYWWNVQAWEPI